MVIYDVNLNCERERETQSAKPRCGNIPAKTTAHTHRKTNKINHPHKKLCINHSQYYVKCPESMFKLPETTTKNEEMKSELG